MLMKNASSLKIFQKNLRICLNSHDMTQADLAKKLKKDKTTINRWFNGSRGVSIETLDMIAECFKIEANKLLNPNLSIDVTIKKSVSIKVKKY